MAFVICGYCQQLISKRCTSAGNFQFIYNKQEILKTLLTAWEGQNFGVSIFNGQPDSEKYLVSHEYIYDC